MRVTLPVVLIALAGCSHAERSATMPSPNATYIVASNIEEDAMADASKFCTYYHSTPAVLADRAGTISRFECTHRY